MDSANPNEILFSVPTIADDLPPLDEVAPDEVTEAFMFHEDDWAQLEFFPIERLGEIRYKMKEYSKFEKQYRSGDYWSKIYIRTIERQPVLGEEIMLAHLLEVIERPASAAPILHTSSEIVGRVANGFSIPLGSDFTLYGYQDETGIPVLGALVDADPDDKILVDTFLTLHETFDVILVDWSGQTILEGVDEESGELVVWQP